LLYKQLGNESQHGGFIGKTCDRLKRSFSTDWRQAAEDACTGCMKCFDTKKGIDYKLVERVMGDDDGDGEDELDNWLVAETANLISLSDCGIEIDWQSKPFYKLQLFQAWRDCEKEVEEIEKIQTAQFQRAIMQFLGMKKK
jgi:hypothetical protein